jgi:hypothetical protein
MPATVTKRKAAVETLPKVIRSPEFARRFEQAADLHPHCPAKHRGRLEWVSDQMTKKGHSVSNETVRKWFSGEATPRPDKGAVLAEIMEVDVAWLQMGIDANLAPRERKARNAMADGAVNVVAGLIQMDGGNPAFPDDDDKRAEREHIDLYAIIRGGSYSLNITLGETEGRKAKFAVPTALGENVIALGVIREGFTFDVFELTPDLIETGARRGASIEVTADASKLRRIEGFNRRL